MKTQRVSLSLSLSVILNAVKNLIVQFTVTSMQTDHDTVFRYSR